MDPREAVVALAAIICGTFLASTVIVSIARIFTRRRRDALPDATAARIEERLSRIEQAIDAMAVEVERVSEGQRFTTKLLSERSTQRS